MPFAAADRIAALGTIDHEHSMAGQLPDRERSHGPFHWLFLGEPVDDLLPVVDATRAAELDEINGQKAPDLLR